MFAAEQIACNVFDETHCSAGCKSTFRASVKPTLDTSQDARGPALIWAAVCYAGLTIIMLK